jgi:hypothetical protein
MILFRTSGFDRDVERISLAASRNPSGLAWVDLEKAMIGGIILSIAGLGALCVLLYNFAVFMLPAYIGLAIAFWVIRTGAGVIGGIAVGLFTGGAVFGIGHVAFTMTRSHIVRWLIAIGFAVPATLAGFGIMTELWDLFMPPTTWRYVFAVVAASATGLTAIARLGDEAAPRSSFGNVGVLRARPSGLQRTMLLPEQSESSPPQRRRPGLPFAHRRVANPGRR